MIITSSIQGTRHDHTGTVLLTVVSEQVSAGHAWPGFQTYATTIMSLAAAFEHTVLRRQSIPASESYRRISSPSFPDAFLRLEGWHQDPRCISDPQQRKSAGHNQPSGDSWTCTYIQDMSPDNTPRCTSYWKHLFFIAQGDDPWVTSKQESCHKNVHAKICWCAAAAGSQITIHGPSTANPECSAVSRRAPIFRVGYTTRASR